MLLGDNFKRGAAVLVALTIAVFTIYEATRLFIAWHMGHSREFAVQVRGAKLEGNAEAWNRLGNVFAADFENENPARAEEFYKEAVKLDPRSARYWMDLAADYEDQGDISSAKSAYEHAQAVYPISADVAWRLGNFLMRQGDESEGLEQIRRAISADSKLAPLAIGLVWSFEPKVLLLLHLLPREESLYLEALDFLASKRQDDAALQVWKEIILFRQAAPPNISIAFPLMDELITSERAEDTQRVWNEVLALTHWPIAPPLAQGSAVWNGGFEGAIANGGLDWHFESVPGDYISIDSVVHHSGDHSLRVDFTGGMNLDFAGVWQFVPVEPSTKYDFRYFMMTRAITTECGMRFEILEPGGPSVNLQTSEMTGSKPWTPVTVPVSTGASTHFLQIRLRRLPSRLFDNKLSGTVWVDDVTLTKAAAANPIP